ncbi:MAG: thioredoxin-disulfide reductase [Candidatus Omnitrophica bacterium]|nr:thioredoxin-disulfide reductase [Candidatus Omnitrophota bacterium]
MYDLIIIGAGPAGLTAALYAGRSRLNTLVLEKISVGGRILMSETIENFPGFFETVSTEELIRRMKGQVESLGIKIEMDEVVDIDCKTKTIKTTSAEYSAKAIIIATGAHPRKLQVPGEEKLTGRGVSYCATCDAPFYKEKKVVVVGGGNTVAEEAIYLTRFAKEVSIIHRRNELRASAILQERLQNNKQINFVLNNVVIEILGSNRVEGVKIKDVETFEEKIFPCDGVFVYIGYSPETHFLRGKLKMDESGFIIADHDLTTSEEGIFVCGDCRKKSLYQVITACGDGATAADSAYKFIASKEK